MGDSLVSECTFVGIWTLDIEEGVEREAGWLIARRTLGRVGGLLGGWICDSLQLQDIGGKVLGRCRHCGAYGTVAVGTAATHRQ
jgi:hypothetical protein